MATIYKVDCPNRKPLFEGVQGENEARSIQFDITAWVEELGAGAVTATAKRPTDAQPYPVTIEQGDGNIVTWKPTSTDTAFEGVGSFQLEYTVDDVLAKTCIWSTQIAPSLDPAGDPPDPYDNWLASMREVAAAAQQSANDSAASAQQAAGEVTNAQTEVKNAEAWAVGTKGGVDVPSTDETYHNNAKYWAEKSNENQYGAYITKSASGSVASFSDGADGIPMKSLKVAIVPKQAGSGDPSPSNVRHISGWTDADVSVAGYNMAPPLSEWVDGYLTGNSGAISGASQINKEKTTPFIPVKEGEQYCFSYDYTGTPSDSSWIGRLYFDANQQAVGTRASLPGYKQTTSYAPAGACYVRYSFRTYDMAKDVQLEIGGTKTNYTPYTGGHTTPVPLGQTVYGGSVNPISGELVIDKSIVTYNGTESWGFETGSDKNRAAIVLPNDVKRGAYTNDICANILKPAEPVTSVPEVWEACINNNGVLLVGVATSIASASDWTSLLSNTNLVLVYPLATPTTVQLTPTQVATLLGTNNVWSDAGDVEVEYRADPTLAYAELQALILENN